MRQICDALNGISIERQFTFQDLYNNTMLRAFPRGSVQTVVGSAVKHGYLSAGVAPGYKKKYIYTKKLNIPEERMSKMMRKEPYTSKKKKESTKTILNENDQTNNGFVRIRIESVRKMEDLIVKQAAKIKELKAVTVRVLDENTKMNKQIRILNDAKAPIDYYDPDLKQYEDAL